MTERVERILIVRALGGLGDLLCATPALRALRTRFPDAEIGYVGLPGTEALVARYPELIDRFVAFPGFPGVPEHPFALERLTAFLTGIQQGRPIDLVVQMHGDGTVTNVFAALLRAKRTACFHLPHHWHPADRGLGLFPAHLAEARRWLALVAALGCDGTDEQLTWHVTAAARAALAREIPELAGRRYAVVHVGASQAARRWGANRFAVIADQLADEGLMVCLTGTAVEAAEVAACATACRHAPLDLTGRTDLDTLGALIEGAELVVSNDTGIAHLTAAIGTPGVTVFTSSDPVRWGALDRSRHRVVGAGRADPKPGIAGQPPAAPPPAIGDVLAAADSLLRVPA